jgi:hypothetical protein
MPGRLARHLAETMLASPPRGWRAVGREVPLLPAAEASTLGYRPAADLVVEHAGDGRKLWIELEISRADPVANHAKFAVINQLHPLDGTYVAMMSPHIVPGRRTLAAHAVAMMRRLGMDAFQTSLFPQLTGARVKELNHMPLRDLRRACPAVEPEWERLIAVVKPLRAEAEHRILFVGDPAEVGWNIARWNRAVASAEGRGLWGGKRGYRVVEHFVWAPLDNLFAPSKFAAFVPAGGYDGMSMALYAQLDESEPRFDGHRAWTHLERLGYQRNEDPGLVAMYRGWAEQHAELLRVKRGDPVIWRPPAWL